MVENLVASTNFGLPAPASDLAEKVDGLYFFILFLSVVVFVALVAVVGFFIIRYRRTPERPDADRQITHHNALEIGWTIIPLLLVMLIFYWGLKDFLALSVAPEDSVEIHVTGKKWLWAVEYPELGKKSVNEIVVPVGQSVKLLMSATDVIHSFYLPNFRVKRDVIPNRYTTVWFKPTRTGTFQIFCTEYCGDGHSNMLASLVVLNDTDYQAWLSKNEDDPNMPLDVLGEKLSIKHACQTCHSVDGSKKTGPTWKGLFGSSRTLTNGQVVKADENYIRESIDQPAVKVLEGYQAVMPPYQGQLSERQMNAIIAFIKSVK